jgi:hypothetical protein
MSRESDPTAIGTILLQMGVITEAQLYAVLDYQKSTVLNKSSGEIFVSFGFCDPEDVEAALEAQNGLRSDNLPRQATAAAAVATQRKKAKTKEQLEMVQFGKELVKKMGIEYTPTPVFGIELPVIKR